MAKETTNEGIVTKVRDRYARIAELGDCGCSCGTTAEGTAPDEIARRIGYDDTSLADVPEGANLGLGCGAPVGHLKLRAGETVVDLGSGAGFDAFIAARSVGPNGSTHCAPGSAHGGCQRRHPFGLPDRIDPLRTEHGPRTSPTPSSVRATRPFEVLGPRRQLSRAGSVRSARTDGPSCGRERCAWAV